MHRPGATTPIGASLISPSLPPASPPGILINMTSNVNQSIEIRFTELKMEDDLKCFVNGRRPQLFVNGRRPTFFCKWKKTSTLL